MAKKYISKIVKGGNDLYLKDSEARVEIADIKQSITGAMHWRGYTTTELEDGDTTNPIIIDGESYTAEAGDVVAILGSGSEGAADKEFVFNGTKWQEYGSTGSLKALAFKDSATGSVTAAGTNAPSAVTFTGSADADFVTGYNNDAVAPSKAADTFTAGSLPSYTEGEFSQGSLPSFTEGTFSAGTLPSFTEGAFNQGTLPSLGAATTGSFATSGEVSSYDEENETLTFSDATTSSAVTAQGTFSAGTLPSKAADTFSAGTLPSKDADVFSAGTLPSKEADSFSAGSLPTFVEGAFSAGSAATLATSKAITSLGSAQAAAQVFTGSAVSVTVS